MNVYECKMSLVLLLSKIKAEYSSERMVFIGIPMTNTDWVGCLVRTTLLNLAYRFDLSPLFSTRDS